MSVMGSEAKIEHLGRFLFNAPSWPSSLLILIVLGFIIDATSLKLGSALWLGTLGFTIPALFACLVTKPAVGLTGRPMTWNRSALLALSCMILGVLDIITSADTARPRYIPSPTPSSPSSSPLPWGASSVSVFLSCWRLPITGRCA